MRLPRSWRAQEHDVLRFQQEPSGGESGDLLTCCRLRVPVEVLESLPRGDPGGFDSQLRARRIAGADFPFEDCGQVVLDGPARGPGLDGHPSGGFGDPGGFLGAGELSHLIDVVRRLARGAQLTWKSEV